MSDASIGRRRRRRGARDRGDRARGDRAGAPDGAWRSCSSCRSTTIDELCAQLAAEYEAQGRGFQLARVAGGYRFQTHPDAYAYVERFVLDGQTARLSGPALETLAIIAYKQPVSRAQLSAIRGVNVDATLKTLVARGYVEEIGHDHSPGNPVAVRTTRLFLERLGLDSLDELPALADFVPDASIVEALERGLRAPDVENRRAAGESDDVAIDLTRQ